MLYEKYVTVAPKAAETEETSNFQSIPAFASFVVHSKLPMFKGCTGKPLQLCLSEAELLPAELVDDSGVLRLQPGEGGQIL